MNATHEPGLRSWVASANDGATDFPIQNLPHGVFRRRSSGEAWRGGVAIGDQVLDIAAALAAGGFDGAAAEAASAAAAAELNGLMALGPAAWSRLRAELSRLLRAGAPQAGVLASCLVAQSEVEHALPAHIGDYTDFFTSRHHMVNAGRVFRPDAPPLPNFRWLPIAYHGRASTVEVSGADVIRPQGQSIEPGAERPKFGPSCQLDYEFELAFWVGPGNARGMPISAALAESHIFGLSLLNDWSARDIQAWEALPLGPFLAKNFLTSVSPWIVTLEALEPFRCALPRDADDPTPLPNLHVDAARAGYDILLDATLITPRSGSAALPLARSSFSHCTWAIAQMLAHHTEGGCRMRPGDLVGTGTQSGPGEREQGCLLELSRGGRTPLQLANGEVRAYLKDGDTVVLRAWAAGDGAVRIGFGECRGTVKPPVVLTPGVRDGPWGPQSSMA